jgi:CRISPR/Cas system CSM-associated protein Csm2 small subunit
MDTYEKLNEKIKKARSLKEIKKLLGVLKKLAAKPMESVDALQVSVSTAASNKTAQPRMRSRVVISSGGITVDRKHRSGTAPKSSVRDFNRPDMAVLVKNFEPIHHLYQLLSVLETAESAMANKFVPYSPAGVKQQARALTRETKNFRAEIESSLREAFKALNMTARKHHPKEMRDVANMVEQAVRNTLDGDSYTDLTNNFYVTPDPDPEVLKIYYTYYVTVEGLDDSMGYEYPDFNVVVSGVLEGGYEEDKRDRKNKRAKPRRDSAGEMSYYITSMDQFRPPGSFRLGNPIAPSSSQQQVDKAVSMLISAADLMTKLEQRPLEVTEQDIENFGLDKIDGVTKVESRDNAVYFTIEDGLSSTDQFLLINNVLNQVKPVLDELTGNRKRNVSIRFKYVKSGGKTKIKFVLAKDTGSKGKDAGINAEFLDTLIDRFGLDSDQSRTLRRQLQSL